MDINKPNITFVTEKLQTKYNLLIINKLLRPNESRSNKLATKLLNKCEEHLKKEKVELFTLEVRESNVAAIKLYEKFGFSKICLKKSYYENGENAIYMMKGVF